VRKPAAARHDFGVTDEAELQIFGFPGGAWEPDEHELSHVQATETTSLIRNNHGG